MKHSSPGRERKDVMAVAVVTLAAVLFAGNRPLAEDDEQAGDARSHRLRFIKQVFDEFRLYRSENPGEPFQQTEEAVLRWSNPIRNFFSDGATFLWLDGERPVAAATISVRGTGALTGNSGRSRWRHTDSDKTLEFLKRRACV